MREADVVIGPAGIPSAIGQGPRGTLGMLQTLFTRPSAQGRASAAADDRPNPATDAATTLLQRSASGRLKKFNHVIPAVATRLWGDDGRPGATPRAPIALCCPSAPPASTLVSFHLPPARRLQNGAAPAEDAALVSLPFRVGSATLAAADDSSGSSILRGAWAGFPSRRVAPGSPSELMLSAKPRSSFEGSPPPRGASRRSRDIPQRPDEMELSGWAGWIPASALEAGSAREDAPRDSPGAHGPSRLGLASPSGPDPALGAAEGSPGVLDRDSAFASLRRGGPSQVEHPKSYLSDDAMGAAKSAEAAFGRARESIETLQPSDAHVLPAAGRAWCAAQGERGGFRIKTMSLFLPSCEFYIRKRSDDLRTLAAGTRCGASSCRLPMPSWCWPRRGYSPWSALCLGS